MKLSVNSPCPCGSGQKYKKCCKIYHNGALPKNAELLMKSRYSAFAASDYKYIIKTTHKENHEYTQDSESWKNSILEFCNSCEFRRLEILDFIPGESEAFVTFKAHIFCDGVDNSFTEKSKFYKLGNMWQYHSGEFIK